MVIRWLQHVRGGVIHTMDGFLEGKTGLGDDGCHYPYDREGLVFDGATKGLPVGDDVDCRVGR